MTNIINHSALVDREIEARVERGVKDLIASGVKPSDITEAHLKVIAEKAMNDMSPAAMDQCAQAGFLHMAKQVIGERLAERFWDTGMGWPLTGEEFRMIAKGMNIAPSEAEECLQTYRDAASDATFEELSVFRSLGRFAPLFLGEPKGATIGEVATRKAARGDKLALSFLAWKEIV
ncbi:hypothetical protein ACTJJ8_21705 [Agrobacterium radiobacter]|uniref:hypothetical protein n=1 Tax=Agrobacterium radiobacter TaxID=362 RepID=UPI003F854E92